MKRIILFFISVGLAILGITTFRKVQEEKPLVIIMIGAPGAGKGTQCVELSKSLQIPHISTGDLFRENIRNQTLLGNQAKDLIEKGQLVPDNIVVNMLFSHINAKGHDKKGYILDGFPRTVNQAMALDQRLGKKYTKIAINLNITEDMLIERIAGRIICKECGASYHKNISPPKVMDKCDKCGGGLYQRNDDAIEIFKNRLQVYNNDTKPILDYYGRKKELINIDSNADKEIVFGNIVKQIDLAK